MKRWTWMAAALLAAPALAHAQGMTMYEGDHTEKRFDVQLQAGVGGYTARRRGYRQPRPVLRVIGAYNQTPFLSYELGYTGNTNAISNTDERLTSNRIQADVKAGPQLTGPSRAPYALRRPRRRLPVHRREPGDHRLRRLLPAPGPPGPRPDFLPLAVRVGARAAFHYNLGIGGSASDVTCTRAPGRRG
jgi:hypothetical protein